MDRPNSLPSVTDKIKTGFGNLYVTISYLEQKPFEVFTSIGKSGYTTMADAEALGRMISLALRSGVDPMEVISQLKGIGGSEPIFTEGGLVQSLPDAIAKVLERHLGESKNNSKDLYQVICKVCGASLPDEKCPTCPNCGWNRCSGSTESIPMWRQRMDLRPLENRGKSFFGVSYTDLAGAMTWISDSYFASAVSNAGAFGSLAAGNMPPELLDEEIQKVKSLTTKPFAVNLITIAPHYGIISRWRSTIRCLLSFLRGVFRAVPRSGPPKTVEPESWLLRLPNPSPGI